MSLATNLASILPPLTTGPLQPYLGLGVDTRQETSRPLGVESLIAAMILGSRSAPRPRRSSVHRLGRGAERVLPLERVATGLALEAPVRVLGELLQAPELGPQGQDR